jgi:hypothetical protein
MRYILITCSLRWASRMDVPIPRFFPIVLLVMTGCAKGDKVPSYLEIPTVTVSTTPLQGAPTSRITDVWVSVNDELLGVWEPPARIPVLYEGTVELRIEAAIKRNGMFDDRLRYPFFNAYKATIELTKLGTTTVQPVVTYTDQASFWIEAFEDPGTLLNTTPASDTTLLRFTPVEHPDIVLNNSPCGGFALDTEHRYIRLYTDEDFEVFGGPVFLELDYRTDIQFTIGVLYVFNGAPRVEPFVYVAPTVRPDGNTYWNKIYVDLSPVFNTTISQRDIYFEGNLPDGSTSANVFFDNIKLVRRIP